MKLATVLFAAAVLATGAHLSAASHPIGEGAPRAFRGGSAQAAPAATPEVGNRLRVRQKLAKFETPGVAMVVRRAHARTSATDPS